jgi:release factor glutamine methyltransferase
MTVKTAKQNLINKLTPQYGVGEATAICRYVFDDYFNLKTADERIHDFLLEDLTKMENRLLAGEPVQYVVGFAWFYGQKFKVNSNVLIPRPETEELVEWVLEFVKSQTQTADLPPLSTSLQRSPFHSKGVLWTKESFGLDSILDIGTGSGCIPTILKLKNHRLQVSAIDISEGALITASRNAYRLNVDVDFRHADILDEYEWARLGHFDVVVSNPPYIPEREKAIMSASVLDYEPHQALFVSNENPLIFYEKIADYSLQEKIGHLFFETNEFNALEVAALLQRKGFTDIELRQDMSGKDRMIRASLIKN